MRRWSYITLLVCLHLMMTGHVQSKVVELTLWMPNKQSTAVVEAFNRQHPELKLRTIVDTPKPNPNTQQVDIMQVLRGRLMDGSVDLVFVPASSASYNDFVRKGLLLNLDRFLKMAGSDTMTPYLHYAPRRTEGTYMLHFVQLRHFVFAHKDMLLAAGLPTWIPEWSWDEFMDWSMKLTSPWANRYGVAINSPNTWAFPFMQSGGNLFEGPYEGLRDGLNMLHRMEYVLGSLAPSKKGWGSLAPNYLFYRKGAAMLIDSTSSFETIGVKEIDKDSVVTLPIPGPAAYKQVGIGTPTLSIAISAKTRCPMEAWNILKWFASPSGARALATSGLIPLIGDRNIYARFAPTYGPNAPTLFTNDFHYKDLFHPKIAEVDSMMNDLVSRFFDQTVGIDEVIQRLNEQIKYITGR